MNYRLRVHPRVSKDFSKLDPPIATRIKKRIKERLSNRPDYFGEPLRGTLKGLWKFRVGDYRVVYRVDAEKKIINILAVSHRKDAYQRVKRRMSL
ncbi:MAG: type II toxin-antitoxin system RelE family toxin [bacterium]